MRRARGFSLVEMLIGAGLLSLVFSVILQTLTPGLKIWNLSQAVGQTQINGMLSYAKMDAELRTTCATSLTVVDEPSLTAVSFLTVDDTPGSFDPSSGQPIWRTVVVYYRDGTSLYRKTWKTGQSPTFLYVLPTSTAFALTSDEVHQLCASASNQGRLLCTDVQKFTFTATASKTTWNLGLQLTAHTQNGDQTCSRQSVVHFRNGG